jgi:hypothetical protein
VEEWQPFADAIKAAFKTAGLLFDAGVTGDAARVLRVPGTQNWKYGEPRPVRLLQQYSPGTRYDFAEVFKDILALPDRPRLVMADDRPQGGKAGRGDHHGSPLLPPEPVMAEWLAARCP